MEIISPAIEKAQTKRGSNLFALFKAEGLLDFLKKMEVRFPAYTAYAYSEEEAEQLRKEAKIAEYYDRVLSTCSATSCGEIAKSIWGENKDQSGNISLPSEIESSIATAMEADNRLTEHDLNGDLKYVMGHTSAHQDKLRQIKAAQKQVLDNPAQFYRQEVKEILVTAGFHPDLFNTPSELANLDLGQLSSLNGKLDELKKAKNKDFK
ncbi:MAG: hypothetical protein EBR67_01755 [Proteobacteria bacterium]|nr:hypothetical protein [Pseudomonadota bacterium]